MRLKRAASSSCARSLLVDPDRAAEADFCLGGEEELWTASTSSALQWLVDVKPCLAECEFGLFRSAGILQAELIRHVQLSQKQVALVTQ